MKRMGSATAQHEEYFLTARDTLRELKNNPAKTGQDLFCVLKDIIANFPQGEGALIHYEKEENYQLLIKELVDTLCKKYRIDENNYAAMKMEKYRGQCTEALILQQLAKLRIPMNILASAESMKNQRKSQIDFKDLVANLIDRVKLYFERSKKGVFALGFGHATYTLSALTRMDISSFEKKSQTRLGVEITNPVIDSIAKTIFEKVEENFDSLPWQGLVRYLHAMILLSKVEDGFQTYIDKSAAQKVLEKIALQLPSLDLQNQEHAKLAMQLIQIRNVYSSQFPQNLSEMIQPFIAEMDKKTHGSAFERQINQKLIASAESLAKIYPDLIDKKYFNANNPINESLGLESDITYENGFIQSCIQVDGDKYHKYPGSDTTTQRTKLRDFCFLKECWQLINFTDQKSCQETVEKELFDKIVVPTYEAIMKNNIELILDFIKNEKEYTDYVVGDEYYSSIVNEVKAMRAQMEQVLTYQNISDDYRIRKIKTGVLEKNIEELNHQKAALQIQLQEGTQTNLSLNEELTSINQSKDIGNTANLQSIKKKITQNTSKMKSCVTELERIDAKMQVIQSEMLEHQTYLHRYEEMFKAPPIGSEVADKIYQLQQMQDCHEEACEVDASLPGCQAYLPGYHASLRSCEGYFPATVPVYYPVQGPAGWRAYR